MPSPAPAGASTAILTYSPPVARSQAAHRPPAAADPARPPADGGRPGTVLLVVSSGTFLSALAGSGVTLALPEIGRELGISLARASWVMQGFLLVVTVLLLVAGWLGDRWGHRRIYLAGFLLFGIASGLCGLARSFELLVGGRLVQGLGGAAVMATGPALLTLSFPATRRGQALGIQATATYLGLTLGPPLSGWLIGYAGWRWVFFLNLPAAAVILGLGAAFVPRTRIDPGRRLDLPGSATLLSGLLLLVLALTEGGRWGWLSPETLGAAAGAGLLLLTFCRVELKRASPLLDPGLFRSPVFRAAALSAVANYAALFVAAVLLPFYLTEGLGMSSPRAGLLLAFQPLVMALAAAPAGSLSDRLGTRSLAVVGMLLMAAALGGMTRLGAESGLAQVGPWLALLGLGTGVFISPNSSALMGSAPGEAQGSAGGVLALARSLGMLVGVAAATALYHAAGGETGRPWGPEDFRALDVALAAAAGISLLGAVAAFGGRPDAGERRR